MAFLYFYIGSCLVILLCWLNIIFHLTKAEKEEFTKEELKQLKKKTKRRSEYPFFVYALLFLTPIINILFTVIIGIHYKDLEKETIREYKKRLGKLSREEKIADAIYKALEGALKDKKRGIANENK